MASTFRPFARTPWLMVSFSKTSQRTSSASWSFVRNQSTAAAAAKPFDKVGKSVQREEDDKVPFESLKGIIRYDTLKAITVKPFKLTQMTPVQATVLRLLPGLIQPHQPNPSEDDPPAAVHDLLVKARTGTGKTLAFLVPAIEARLNAIEAAGKQAVLDAGLASDKSLAGRAKRIFARTENGVLIISPTRELASQIANEALRLAHHHDDFGVRLFTGGASKGLQMRDWMRGRRDITVATPGRLLDLLNSEPEIKNGIAKTQMLILDEADTLLDMGFRDDIEAIKEFLPPTPQRQTFLFSATISRQIQQVARSMMDRNHVFINTVSDHETPVHAHVPQFHTVLPSAADQIPHILRLIAHDQLTNPGKSKIILFLATTKLTQLFSTLLRELLKTAIPSLRETRVYEIHSKRTQESRSSTSDAFRQDKTGASILVTSDVSARGVDYPGVTRVIQLGIPGGTEQYIHRIGRTGRAGTGGRGDLVLLPWEVGFLTWQLNGIPLKPVTTNELKAQLNTLAEAYDADPKAAFKDISVASPVASSGHFTRLNKNKPKLYPTGQQKLVENIPAEVNALIPSLDEEAIKETFASMLGFYLSKSQELRVQKGAIVQGCKDWTTEACGLPVPPYVSEDFLQRMGFPDGRMKRSGRSYGHERRGRDDRSAPWTGRGRQKSKEGSREFLDWTRSRREHDSNDSVDGPDEYRTGRYNSKTRSSGRSSYTDYGDDASTRQSRGSKYGSSGADSGSWGRDSDRSSSSGRRSQQRSTFGLRR